MKDRRKQLNLSLCAVCSCYLPLQNKRTYLPPQDGGYSFAPLIERLSLGIAQHDLPCRFHVDNPRRANEALALSSLYGKRRHDAEMPRFFNEAEYRLQRVDLESHFEFVATHGEDVLKPRAPAVRSG